MTIYDSSGVVVYDAPINTSAIIKRELMGDYYIEMTFDVVDRINVGRGCYIFYNNNKFEILSNVTPEHQGAGYRYTLRFEAQQSQMKRCKVFWREGATLEVAFSNTTTLSTFGKLIVDNVNAFLGSYRWRLGDVPTDLNNVSRTVAFNGDYCWDAVNNIAETFNVEWWTEEDIDQVRLYFGKLEHGDSVDFKRGEIVTSISSKKGDDSSYGTRFYVFGSTKNLPSDYASAEEGGITNHIVEKRLHLPNGQMYIDAWTPLAQEDIVEQVVFLDDIFPKNTETVTNVTSTYEEVIEGYNTQVYTIECANTPFTPEDLLEGEEIGCNFTSGNLKGMTFGVEINKTNFDKKFKIIPNIIDAEGGVIIPNNNLRPRTNDTFVLTGVNLPKQRIAEAEQELLEAGIELAQKRSSDTDVHDCSTNAVYCHENDCNYNLGQRVRLVSDSTTRESRIQSYEKKLYDEYQAVYSVGDNRTYSRLSAIEKNIQKGDYSGRVGLEANIIRSKSDSTIPSDYNVYSALATEDLFLSKKRGGIVKGFTSFQKGIDIGGIEIVYDKDNKAVKIGGNAYALGGLTAGGVGSSGSGGGGGESYNRLDSWSDYSADKSGWVLSALLGNDLNTRLISVENAGYITTSALAPYALRSEIPSLEGYATLDALNTLSQTVVNFKSLFDSMFEKDSDGNIHAKLSLWSSGGITAGGVGSGGSGGGGISYNRLDSWADYSADKSGWVLSALLGNDLNTRLISVENAGYITTSALAPYALRSEIPSLEGYATLDALNTLSQTVVNFKSLFDSMFEKDSEGNIHAKLSLWSSGGITAGGVGSGGSGGGGISYNRLDSWSDYSVDKSGWVLSALLGKDLDNRVSALTNAGYITASYLAPYALRSEIPSLVGYATQSWVGDNYLSKSGGVITGQGDYAYVQLRLSGDIATIGFQQYGVDKGVVGWLGNTGIRLQNLNGYGLAVRDSNDPIYYWGENGSVQRILLHAGNYSSYALPITGGTVNGSITASSFIGNLTGTADKASTQAVLYSNRDVNLWDTDASAARYFALGDTAQNTPSGVYALGSILMEYSWDTNAGAQLLSHNRGNNIFYRSRWNGAFKDWREIAFTDSNVASATKLATPRLIWGQSFDGTQDVTGALTAPAITTNSLTIGGVTLTYDSANEALCINGNMYALGGITAGGAGISAYTSLEARVARLEQQLNIS